MLGLGFKHKVDQVGVIGRWGQGFQAGSLRLARKAVVMYQKDEVSRLVGMVTTTQPITDKALRTPMVEYTKRGRAAWERSRGSCDADSRMILEAVFGSEADLHRTFDEVMVQADMRMHVLLVDCKTEDLEVLDADRDAAYDVQRTCHAERNARRVACPLRNAQRGTRRWRPAYTVARGIQCAP